MVTAPVLALSCNTRTRPRTAIIASSDRSFRERISETLTGLRWQVREGEGGADVWSQSHAAMPEAVIVDSWLPDLELAEFIEQYRGSFPQVDLIVAGEATGASGPRGPYRQELLYALRRCQDSDTAAWNAAPEAFLSRAAEANSMTAIEAARTSQGTKILIPQQKDCRPNENQVAKPSAWANRIGTTQPKHESIDRIPELIGNAPCMTEVSRRIRLVAPRMTPVLIEGPTGSGKELVAEAVHRLSSRSRKPFVVLNCAAIPEALLETELFGHTRGAFTGAVQGRVGRIEAADAGTLFLDEIGELPLSLQSKLLRFVECGELQRVGDNDRVKVDVRIVAATHRPLGQLAHEGAFRSDLYYRLAVFLIRTPALVEHGEDIPILVNHFLDKLGKQAPVKGIEEAALAKLMMHGWPGNVRELQHVLERAVILAGDAPTLTVRDIDFGYMVN